MHYRIGIRRGAKEEFEALEERYGVLFVETVRNWLQVLADEAEANKQVSSVDAKHFLSYLIKHFRNAPFLEKLQALFIFLTQQTAPYELRMASSVFLIPNPNGMPPDTPIVVTLFFEVDRPNKRIVVSMFTEPKISSV